MKRLLAYLFLVLSLGILFNVNAEDKPKSWIGIEFIEVTEDLIKKKKLSIDTPKNIIVTGVVKTSAADEAKILPEDIIISIDNNIIKKSQDLINLLKSTKPGDIISAKIYRNGTIITKKIKLKKYPDPGFKAEWVAGSNKSKDLTTTVYMLENTILTHPKDEIFYPKYFSKDLVNKYKKKVVVACVQKNTSKNILKLNDEIIAIDGEPLGYYFELTNKPTKIKIKRNNKIIYKTITPTIFEAMNVRHDCAPEYLTFDCGLDYLDSWRLQQKSKGRGDALQKALDCMKEASIVPFSSFSGKKEDNFKMEILRTYIGYLQYDDPNKDLDKINKVLEIAKVELKEFEKFQKLYPNHPMQKPYNELITAITRATQWAAGSYSDDIKSTKDTTIKTDKDTVKSTKLALDKIIKDKKINSPEAIKFLTNKRTYFKKANEYDYLIKKYLEAKNTINWQKDDLDKYFDNIYSGLSDFYILQQKYEAGIDVLNEGLKIAENNYENLYFKNAYSEFSRNKMLILMMFKTEILLNESKNFIKALSRHVSHLESLSSRDKERMLEIDYDYYLDILLCLYLFDILGMEIPDKINKTTYYPLKQLDFIKANKKYDFVFEYPMSLSSLLQASVIDDDLKNFNFANNELAILFSKSAGDFKKLSAIRSIAPMIISAYESNGFYLKSDNFIKFVEDVFTLDEQIKNNPIIREQFVLFSHYQAQSAIRNNNIEKAKKIYETGFEFSKPNIINFSNYTLYDVMVASKYVPELYEIYFNEKNYKKLNRVNRSFISNDISNLSKKDLKYISYLDLNSYKVFKIYLKYFEEKNDKKKFKMVKNHIIKKLDKSIKQLKKNDARELLNLGTSRDLVLREIAEIAQILIKNSYKNEGTEILNKIYPIIIDYFKEKSSAVVWKPNIEDNVFGLIYLDTAENYLKLDKSFIKKAYKVAQIGKNVFTSRDLNKAISKKKFKDKDGLIEKYEKIQRELTVNLRSAQFAPKEVAGNTKISEELNNKNRKLQNEIEQLEKDIEKKIPSYFKITKIQTAKISELQKLLKKDELMLDYYFYEKELKVVSISNNKIEILSNKSDYKNLNKLNKEVRNTLIPLKGTIKPFAVNKSFNLNEETFLFLDKATKNYKNIIIIPDGPLNSMPLHALANAKSENCLDCRNIKFNLHNHNFSYFPSADTFVNIDKVANEFKAIKKDNTIVIKISNKKALETIDKTKKIAKGLLSKIKINNKKLTDFKKENKTKISKTSNKSSDNLFYLGIGDPDLYSKIENTKINDEDKVMMLRSLFDAEAIDGNIIKQIYGPVAGSADEIKNVAKQLLPLKSKILLRENANELNLKEIDLSSYKVIHFATHGEISGALEGFNEPFLVLSPPTESSIEDGLLTMSEIMSLDTNADLVVLSACNTASGDEVGSEGLSGLTKSFFISGSKSVLVSNWYVETYSAKEIVINLFKNLKNNSNLTISNALNTTMLNMLNNQKDRSHPMFWAPFVLVGQNKKLSF
tara:strand:+ start:1365 stop:5828 length:4464 start_codon:yes stop_codon:yes gene_type:complete